MKLIQKPYLLILISAILILSSCKDDDPQEVSPASIYGEWKQVAGMYSPTFNGISDYFSGRSACNKDDILVLNLNNTYEYNEGASKCSESDPQVYENGSISISGELTSITIGNNEYVLDFDSNTMQLSSVFTANGGITYTDTQTYQRQ
jgi:hypothetical protein